MPDEFQRWPTIDRARWAALELVRLRARALNGNADAAEFFRRSPFVPPTPAPVPSPKRLRVGIVSLALMSPGGVETWIRSLVRLEHPGITISGVAVTGTDYHLGPIREIAKRCPVLIGSGSVEQLAADSDVLIVWGMDLAEHCANPHEGRGRVEVVVVSHGCGRWTERILRPSALWAGHRVAVSAVAAEAFPGGDSNVEVIWNGADESRVRFPGGRDAARDLLGLRSDEVALLFCGRLAPDKRPLDVCHAAAALGPPFVPVLAGSRSGRVAGRIEAEARKICARVRIVGNLDPPGAAFAGSDVFFLTSQMEGFSIALIEAWLAGLPAIATPVGIVPEAVTRWGGLVELVPINPTPGELAAAVRAAISPSGRALAERAQTIARREFSEAAFLDRWGAYLVREFVPSANSDEHAQSGAGA